MLRPQTEQDLADAVAAAPAPLRIIGGGTRDFGRPVDGDPLCVAGLSGITLYEPGALTMVAQAGTPLTEIDAALTAKGQRLPFEPTDMRGLLGTTGTPTIGGVFATNASGPRRVQVGAARDFLLGVRYVDGRGTVVKNGGRVMKNVTGYDLVKLMAGSHGTLGVLTEVSFKVLPVPKAQATLTLPDLNEVDGLAAMSAALGSPFEVSGASQGMLSPDCRAPVFFRIEGFASSVAYRADQLSQLLARFGQVEVTTDPVASARIWEDIRDVSAFRDHAFVARMSIRPSTYPAFLFDAMNTFLSYSPKARGFDLMTDWGSGLVWVGATAEALTRNADVAPDPGSTDPQLLGARLLMDYLHSFCAVEGGHATLIKGPRTLREKIPSFQPEAASIAALTAALRARFDPRDLLNPGIML